ncbi:MAG TPA: hypothetical protein VFA52_00135 [Candidatus Paceibacterota bacterium]|nr:hypothetical protein [Candidatus Paceibacterota bacterium]
MKLTLAILLLISLAINATVIFGPTYISRKIGAPIPDKGSFGYISTDPDFFAARRRALGLVNIWPIGTIPSSTNSHLKRDLYANGALFNLDDDLSFIEELGDAKAFPAFVSDNPERDAKIAADSFNQSGFAAKALPHRENNMQQAMWFVSFKDSRYNPGWPMAFRWEGRKQPDQPKPFSLPEKISGRRM